MYIHTHLYMYTVNYCVCTHSYKGSILLSIIHMCIHYSATWAKQENRNIVPMHMRMYIYMCICVCICIYIYYMCMCMYIYSQYTIINWDDVEWPPPVMVCYWAQPLSVWSVSHPSCRTTVPHPGNATYPNWLLTGHWNALEFGWMVMTFIEIWWTYIYI